MRRRPGGSVTVGVSTTVHLITGTSPMPAPSRAAGFLRLSIALMLAGGAVAPLARAMPPLPLAQVSLTELQATQQARQQMEANAAAPGNRPQMNPDDAAVMPAGDPAAGAGADAGQAAPAGGGGGLLKYLPAYVLLVLFTGLGIAAAGRPVRRVAPDGT
jgi:hypothetical protein